ncbi:uncharacterized protein PAN0_015d5100 [Moesziomyces antarcticus]|uniref:Rho-GAP domain-containing protein n=2 Tax=Pseudozyma antarctica TaxID=84753 RepID=A0A081CJN0_PSEA2|nr:uncharacterized protein PAN0_015d5100 [Moesziomyces antarcticus]GAK66876.1 conserved hypothetical protein [Moesziomyces antarcticus]
MPFTRAYSSQHSATMDPSTSTHASSSSHLPSSPRQADSPHHAYASPDAPLEHDSSRSRLFSSGRKSPDPFRRFRRNSNNSLHILTAPPTLDAAQSFDAQQYHLERQDRSIPDYPAALNTPRSAPPPLPSPSTKPVFQRPKRTKSSSISILSSGLARRPKDSLPPSSSSPDVRRRHRKSASLSGSDVDFSSNNNILDSTHSRPATPMMRPASPSPSLSDSLAFPPASAAYRSKQHKQAWYQAQQKTIELDGTYNRGVHSPESGSAHLFPLNVTTTQSNSGPATDRARSSPTHSRSDRPVVETFLSEEEMLAAGIHIIRRRDQDAAPTPPASHKHLPSLSTTTLAPTKPPRLDGADQPDFLELIDSPIPSKHASPLLGQLVDPPASSATLQRAISHTHAKSSSGSISMSSADSNDYLPLSNSQHQVHRDDSSSLNNGSTSSLGSTGKHSFSFAKLRRNGAKNKDAASSSRPSTANSSNEEVNSVKSFLYPTRAAQPQPLQTHQSRQQTPVPAAPQSDAPAPAAASPPGYLSPGPSSSASPFLNKHSATVGRASGSSVAGHTAKNGLTQVFGGGSGAASLGPSSSAASARGLASTNGVPPPKPPKPKPSLLAAFPRSDNATPGVSISAPTSANLDSRYPVDGASRNLLSLPGQAGYPQEPAGNSIYRNISHSRSQEAVAEARLDAEALRASAGTPMPPPRRLNQHRNGLTGADAAGSPAYSAYSSSAMGRSTSGGAGGVVGALGHVGQFGAAMGRKGWDFMKTLQTSNAAATSARNGTHASAYRAGGAGASSASSLAAAAENEPTRQWLLLLEAPESSRSASLRGPGEVFGASLQDAVLRSRLSSISTDNVRAEDHLGVPDLGQKFSANFLDSPGATPRASVASAGAGEPVDRDEARHLYLPRLVVRCIQSLERWGPSEEGIYRISGRSSHTAKLRAHFADPRNDLRLDEISPADLDINSVCSLLKSYLRELPDTLIPPAHTAQMDAVVARLFAGIDSSAPAAEVQSAAAGKASEARAAQIPVEHVAKELTPLVQKLPVHNWYLLRELTHHLGLLAQPDVVAHTKMPLSNLTLVLAPTLSISLALLQVLVRHRDGVFGAAPHVDVASAAASALAGASKDSAPASPAKGVRPPRPVKPERLSGASKLPVMVRKRASSMGLGALLSSPTSKTADARDRVREQHRRTSSTTPSLELPADITASVASGARTPPPPSPRADEPYERPSTSLGHFEAAPARARPGHARFGSRDAALRFDALALDDRGDERGDQDTPIARYYARIREEAELASTGGDDVAPRDGAATPVAPIVPVAGEMHRYWAEKTAAGRSGRTSALDRPRPPTSGSASFFAGRSRRQDSVNGLAAFKPGAHESAIPSLVRNGDEGTTRPLHIVKRTRARGASDA